MEDALAAEGAADGAACGHHSHQHDAPGGGPAAAEQEGGADPAYISLFLLKYVCPAEGCYGTLAPLPPGAGAGDQYECNMCGRRRSEAEFMAELEAAQ